ncbi:glycosyltransferase [Thermoflavifilum thermophilum]|uniref:Glycosyltransferase involved in cell wall bisynthesis n=1 Tax=Thermoflavifilum thermophilum TaxID=1393122 RepID=A0A1I7NBL3_9BACT|nr:glycosyltransferase [Thermoflavifilum thermophilum]SFV32031.1 Glycosyltransferase involved in cell wall bisynthesis [Thermoflavifilum thermophilum]
MSDSLTPGISILMCCHNSISRLPLSFGHLRSLLLPEGWNIELLIVDNASTDGTMPFAREYWQGYAHAFEVRPLEEQRLGLSHARLRGILEARYPYVLLCDDDNGLLPDYLLIACQILTARKDAPPGMLGGQGLAVFETTPPPWAPQFHLFGCGPQAPQSGPAKQLYGAGSILWKPAFMKIYHAGFRWLLTDRQGNQLSSGGDYELCAALKLAGYPLWFESRMQFVHYIEAHRLALNYYQRFIREASVSENILLLYRSLPLHMGYSRWPVRWMALQEAGYHIFRIASMLIRRLFSFPSKSQQTVFRLRLFYHGLRIYHLLHLKKICHNNWPRLVEWYQHLQDKARH